MICFQARAGRPAQMAARTQVGQARVACLALLAVLCGGAGVRALGQVPQGRIPRGQHDEWCWRLADGLHADTWASPPCSGYFECRAHRLTGLHACAAGLLFSRSHGKCVRASRAACPARAGQAQAGVLEPGSDQRRILRGLISRQRPTRGFNYQAASPWLPEGNALLQFKGSVLDFENVLASWVPPRNGSISDGGSDAQGTGASGQNVLGSLCPGGPCAATKGGRGRSCWAYVACNSRGKVVGLEIPAANLSSLLGQQAIPVAFSALTDLERLSIPGNPNEPLFGLTGGIPSELSTLQKLTFLDLSNNKLSGTLDRSNVALSFPALQFLNLTGNWLVGPIPATISALTELEFVDLSLNQLNGSIPSTIGRLAKLTHLNLQSNQLSGSIPASLGAAVFMHTLYMQRNSLEGSIPDALSSMASLAYLDLSENQLSGTVPSGLSALTSLATLVLRRNALSGRLPLRTACAGRALFSLVLSENNFTGSLSPREFAGCAATLNNLNVSHNALTGIIPPAFFNKKLVLLSFLASNNRLSGPIPSTVASAPWGDAAAFDVSFNQLSGPVPQAFPCFSYMYINLASNNLSGAFPFARFACTLDTLDISNNSFRGPLDGLAARGLAPKMLALNNNRFAGPFPQLAGSSLCKQLAQFNASGNQISGAIPDLRACTVLNSLDLSANALSQPISAAIAALPRAQLGSLNLSRNLFTDALPAQASALSALQILDLSQNRLSGPVPSALSRLRVLRHLDLSGNALASVPEALGNISQLGFLDLSRNSMEGPIPASLAPQRLPDLLFLDLSHNQFNGSIPYGFKDAKPPLRLSFANNQLCGQVPPGNLSMYYEASVFVDNACLCDGAGLPECPAPPSPLGSSLSVAGIVGISCAGLALLCALFMLCCCFFLRRQPSDWEGGTMLVFEKTEVPITVHQLLASTDSFSEKHLLGRGGFGSVYRGALADGRTVAIKRLAAGSGQGQTEFQAEMQILGNIRHRNLVVLVAAYVAKPPSCERLLIYEYLPEGSLDRVLTKDLPKDSTLRSWPVRRKIIEDVARGLKYLHHDCTPRIVHRDMKPANVLLDERFGARVADFGLAREFDATRSHVSTSVFGTIGYLAPEYTTRGRLSFKSDVFAFGVMVLQVVTGKQPTDEDVAERGLARWVGGGSALSVCDPRIEDAGNHLKEIMGVITLGLRCTSRVPSDRPSMEEVVYSLDHLNTFAQGFGRGKPE